MKKILAIFILMASSSCTLILSKAATTIDENMPRPASNVVSDDFNEISLDETYQISVPESFEDMDVDDPYSLIYVGNNYRSLYVTVYTEPTIDFVEFQRENLIYNDSISTMDNFVDYFKVETKIESNTTDIEDYGLLRVNGYIARQVKLFINEGEIPLTYIVTFLDDGETIYKIMSWTTTENLRHNIGIMEQIPFTFEKKIIF